MRILYGSGFSPEERHEKVSSIMHNSITFIKTLCVQAEEMRMAGGEEGFGDHKVEASAVMEANDNDMISEELGGMISKLWKECGSIRLAWQKRSEFQIIESNAEYMERIHEIR